MAGVKSQKHTVLAHNKNVKKHFYSVNNAPSQSSTLRIFDEKALKINERIHMCL